MLGNGRTYRTYARFTSQRRFVRRRTFANHMPMRGGRAEHAAVPRSHSWGLDHLPPLATSTSEAQLHLLHQPGKRRLRHYDMPVSVHAHHGSVAAPDAQAELPIPEAPAPSAAPASSLPLENAGTTRGMGRASLRRAVAVTTAARALDARFES